jgi:hypothetical protein
LVFDRGNQSTSLNSVDVRGVFDPFIQIHLAAGRSEEQKRAVVGDPYRWKPLGKV